MAMSYAQQIPAVLPIWQVRDRRTIHPDGLVDAPFVVRGSEGNLSELLRTFGVSHGKEHAVARGQFALATASTSHDIRSLNEATLVRVEQSHAAAQVKILYRVRITDVTTSGTCTTARWSFRSTLRELRPGTPCPKVLVTPPLILFRRPELPGQYGTMRGYPALPPNHLACPYWMRCKAALEEVFRQCGVSLDQLGGQGGRNPAEDRCFCAACHGRRGDRMIYQRGGKDYVQPVGFSRVAFRPAKSDCVSQTGLSQWNVCYHGTTHRSMVDIVKQGHLLAPGTRTYLGTEIKVRSGHLKFPLNRRNEHTGATEVFDPRTKVFFSPSARYCQYGHAYADDFPWAGKRYHCILQVRIQPGTYKIGQETVGLAGRRIDEHIPNSSIEWYSEDLHSHFITGVLLKESA